MTYDFLRLCHLRLHLHLRLRNTHQHELRRLGVGFYPSLVVVLGNNLLRLVCVYGREELGMSRATVRESSKSLSCAFDSGIGNFIHDPRHNVSAPPLEPSCQLYTPQRRSL